jgi:hypothetical protein
MDFIQNCIFLEEYGFNVNMRRRARNTPLITIILTTKVVPNTIVGDFTAFGAINLSMRNLRNFKRRVTGARR